MYLKLHYRLELFWAAVSYQSDLSLHLVLLHVAEKNELEQFVEFFESEEDAVARKLAFQPITIQNKNSKFMHFNVHK